MIEDFFRRVPLERNGENLGLMSRAAQSVAQAFGVNLSTTANERNLDRSDEDPHAPAFRPMIA
jgi:hypothetical protein